MPSAISGSAVKACGTDSVFRLLLVESNVPREITWMQHWDVLARTEVLASIPHSVGHLRGGQSRMMQS